MPLSERITPEIITVPIVSPDNDFTFAFDFDLPTVPLNTGAKSAQILWTQFVYSATATVGTRVPVFDLLDDAASQVFAIASINTQGAGTTVVHSLLQGAVIFPVSIFGLMRTIPVDGLFAFNDYSIRIHDIAVIDPADTFVGVMQVRLF